jgi:RNA polymerase sigma factor (sigma-70 family)
VVGVDGAQEQLGHNGEAVRAASEIIRRYEALIRSAIRFKAGKTLDEDDLLQEFFLVLIRKPVPADVRNIKSFLYRAVLNHVIDATRAQRNYERLLAKYAKEARISIHEAGARNASIEDEQQRAIAYCIRHLPQRQAQAFVLRYRDNYSIPEIAKIMAVGRRTVSRYLSECLRVLRRRPAVE